MSKEVTVKYSELYSSLYASLSIFANKYVSNLEESKGIVQDVFVKLWNHSILEKDKQLIKSWLYTSVRNKSLDYIKSKEHCINMQSIPIGILESDAYFEKEVLIEEVFRKIDKAVDSLPYSCKQVVLLSMKGYDNASIGKELGISINTVKTQKKIAYQKLRVLLNKCLIIQYIIVVEYIKYLNL